MEDVVTYARRLVLYVLVTLGLYHIMSSVWMGVTSQQGAPSFPISAALVAVSMLVAEPILRWARVKVR